MGCSGLTETDVIDIVLKGSTWKRLGTFQGVIILTALK